MAEGIIYRYRYGIAWRAAPEVFGPWQTIWAWHRRMVGDGRWDAVLQRPLTAADVAGQIGWAGLGGFHDRPCASARHQYHSPRRGWVELHGSAEGAA
ncbi:hypothetical protein GCM10027521_55930 [Amycolatopsis cihanbeyliensis]